MARYLDGDSQAFSEIYDHFSPPVYRYLYRKCFGQKESAEELLQSTFLKFHRQRKSYKSQYSLLQWLYVIARSELVDFQRKLYSRERVSQIGTQDSLKGSEVRDSPPQDSPPQDVQSREKDWSRDWDELLQGLSADAQAVVRARVEDEESFEDMAKRLQKTPASLRQVYHRAKAQLQKLLAARKDRS